MTATYPVPDRSDALTPTNTCLPDGFAVRLAPDVHRSRNGRLLFGGAPPRLVRLSERTANILAPGEFEVSGPVTRAVARRLLDAGIVNPRPPEVKIGETTVVIPVRDRADMLERLLAALRRDPQTADIPIVVVDDGSREPLRITVVARRNGARVFRHAHNSGPAAARNTGLSRVKTPFVVCIDSDVVPQPGWLSPLLAQFLDPAVALAAPRVVPLQAGESTWLERFERTCSPLDMGTQEGLVAPLTRLPYVPTAAVVLRRQAFPGFASDMRVGEDVDLCMRLHGAGWRLRYVPSSSVAHEHRTELRGWIGQRAFYGTGAAPLALRHPGRVPTLYASWWSLLATALLTHRRCAPLAGILVAVVAARLARRMPDADAPVRAAVLLAFGALHATARQLVQAATRHYWPIGLAAAVSSRRARRILVIAAAVEGLLDHRRSKSELNPMAHIMVRRLDDLCYGTGLWWGALRARTIAPLLPKIVGCAKPVRPEGACPPDR